MLSAVEFLLKERLTLLKNDIAQISDIDAKSVVMLSFGLCPKGSDLDTIGKACGILTSFSKGLDFLSKSTEMSKEDALADFEEGIKLGHDFFYEKSKLNSRLALLGEPPLTCPSHFSKGLEGAIQKRDGTYALSFLKELTYGV